jgi:hypothetical protein
MAIMHTLNFSHLDMFIFCVLATTKTEHRALLQEVYFVMTGSSSVSSSTYETSFKADCGPYQRWFRKCIGEANIRLKATS